MKAVAGEVPTDDAGWAFEIKWDGMRVTSILGGDEPVAVSTNGRDVVGRFPELRLLNDHLGGHRVALDGEIVILDDQGRSDFGRLQPRMQAGSDAAVARLLGDGPATYVVFDLLAVGDLATVELPYVERRRLLADLLQDGPTWRVPEHRIGGGNDLFEAAAATGLEGIMAKRVDSPYLPGRRSSSWRKCKVRHRQEFVVGGWTRGEGTRGSTFGSLHVGYRDPSAPGSPLRYAGRVGSGLTDADLRHLKALLAHCGSPTARSIPRHHRSWPERARGYAPRSSSRSRSPTGPTPATSAPPSTWASETTATPPRSSANPPPEAIPPRSRHASTRVCYL
jgi:bifunctional non-homologous end joining protein LigD